VKVDAKVASGAERGTATSLDKKSRHGVTAGDGRALGESPVVSVKFCKRVAGDAGLDGVEPDIAQAPAKPGRRQVADRRRPGY
jgi:hypothetical protein